ncbi:GxxExxY protein [Opitutaceae bacterium]
MNLGEHSSDSRRDAKTGIMKTNDLSVLVADVAYQIHSKVGPGLLESVYEELMVHELTKRGLKVERQVPVPIAYDGIVIDLAFRADLVVEGALIIELKSVEALAPVHKKQLLTYLKIAGMPIGLLINFGSPLIKDGIVRMVNQMPE